MTIPGQFVRNSRRYIPINQATRQAREAPYVSCAVRKQRRRICEACPQAVGKDCGLLDGPFEGIIGWKAKACPDTPPQWPAVIRSLAPVQTGIDEG